VISLLVPNSMITGLPFIKVGTPIFLFFITLYFLYYMK
jgi:hypothetical protein